jgi:hypothetical protein
MLHHNCVLHIFLLQLSLVLGVYIAEEPGIGYRYMYVCMLLCSHAFIPSISVL